MPYQWDPEKNRTNRRKHRVDFADAVSALEDDQALTMRDEDATEEERYLTLGVDLMGRVLLVVYTWRQENIRVISARRATRRERDVYEGKP